MQEDNAKTGVSDPFSRLQPVRDFRGNCGDSRGRVRKPGVYMPASQPACVPGIQSYFTPGVSTVEITARTTATATGNSG
jgi:hypothetical protein